MRAMIGQHLMPSGDASRVDEFIGEDYIQHEVPDGRAPFAEVVQAPDRPLLYHEIVLLVGQGNSVATLSRASWGASPTPRPT